MYSGSVHRVWVRVHLVQALGLQAIKQGHTVLYRLVFDLVRDFLHEEVQLSSESAGQVPQARFIAD